MAIFKQMRTILIIMLMGNLSHAGPVHIDIFHLLQKRLVLNYEHKVNDNHALRFGFTDSEMKSKGVSLDLSLYELSYRRYIQPTAGVIFWSFGVRSGPALISTDAIQENEILVMPFYDVGVKSKLSERWVHELRLEMAVVQLYTDEINVNHLLGLQWTPYFSFGYRLD
ncbi:MAG: hypothetical protein ACON35_03855 [Candidatus Marinamargulisbacteria bacterium]